jgi:DNA-binding MarR family transcriptional regulator
MFRDLQLSTTEIIVLVTMNKKKRSRVSDLAALIGVPSSTLTGILDRLVQQGLLERSQDPEDRRGVIMAATPKLASSIRELMTPLKNTLKASLESIPKPRIKRLAEDLRFMLDRMECNANTPK